MYSSIPNTQNTSSTPRNPQYLDSIYVPGRTANRDHISGAITLQGLIKQLDILGVAEVDHANSRGLVSDG